MEITIKGKKVTRAEAIAHIEKVLHTDGPAMLNKRIEEAKQYAQEECGQPSSWMDGMEIRFN